MKKDADKIAEAILDAFTTEELSMEAAPFINLVHPLYEIGGHLKHLGDAIFRPDSSGGPDASGGHVTSLTEAVMGVSAGLQAIAGAIRDGLQVLKD